jgi:IS5 family transposase
LTQEKNDKNKIYSIHEPDVECISKGKERKKYEFGNKVSLVATPGAGSVSAEGFVVGAQGLHGNPYDGHTLAGALAQAERLCGEGKIKQATEPTTGTEPATGFTDLGYRGHAYHGSITVQICDHRKSKKKVAAHVAKFNEATSGDRADDRTSKKRKTIRTQLPARKSGR